tara:strand:- start:968 stop:1594 length:627 start_codon:yes stop_codon:yes gene_type:complete
LHLVLRFVLLALVSCTIISGLYVYVAHVHFGVARATIEEDSFYAFRRMVRAVHVSRLDPDLRKNATMALVTLMADRPTQVQLSPGAADKFHNMASSAAKYSPAVLMIRAQYLLNSGRWKDDDEIIHVLRDLRRSGSLYSGTWLMEAHYAIKSQNIGRLIRAIDRGLALKKGHPDHMDLLRRYKAELTSEIPDEATHSPVPAARLPGGG